MRELLYKLNAGLPGAFYFQLTNSQLFQQKLTLAWQNNDATVKQF